MSGIRARQFAARFGVGAFLFFTIKGIAWLILFGAAAGGAMNL